MGRAFPGVAVSVLCLVKDHSAFTMEKGLEKGKTGRRRLLQSSRQEKDDSGWTRMTIMEMEKGSFGLFCSYTYWTRDG